jgi:hypothetical protein
MQEAYKPCECGSGKKFRFCCGAKSLRIDPVDLIKESAQFPLYECLEREDWEPDGLACFYISRQLTSSRFTSAIYLVDTFCLGLKNTMVFANINAKRAAEMKTNSRFAWTACDYEDARSWILGGIAYAESLGFEPNVDWKDSQYLIEADKPFDDKFTFGKNGKPLFMNGPDDNVAAVRAKLAGHDARFVIRAGPPW